MSDIWQVAMDMEVKGRDYYLELAEKSSIGEVKGICKVLADEEQRHYNLFESLQKGMPVEAAAGADVGKVAKEAFEKIAGVFDPKAEITDAVDAYTKALELENGGIQYYTEIMGKLDDDMQKSAVDTVISEEKRHAKLVQGLVDFVSRPEQYLENAEFTHLENI